MSRFFKRESSFISDLANESLTAKENRDIEILLERKQEEKRKRLEEGELESPEDEIDENNEDNGEDEDSDEPKPLYDLDDPDDLIAYYDMVASTTMHGMREDTDLQMYCGLNAMVVIFSIIGFVQCIQNLGIASLQLFSFWADALLLGCSFLYVIFGVRRAYVDKAIPRWVEKLKFISISAAALVMFMSIFVLLPQAGFSVEGFKSVFIDGFMKYFHGLAPAAALISFIVFEDARGVQGKKYAFIGMIPLLAYGIMIIAQNMMGIVEGPYSFLMMKSQLLVWTIVWLVAIPVCSFFLNRCLQILARKMTERRIRKEFEGIDFD